MNELSNTVLEMKLLGAVLRNATWLHHPRVMPSLFSTKEHRDLYNVAFKIVEGGMTPTPTAIGIGSKDESLELLAVKVSSIKQTDVDFEVVIKELCELQDRRALTESSLEAYNALHDPDADLGSTLSKIESDIRGVRSQAANGVTAGEDMSEVLSEIDWRMKHPNDLRGLKFGFPQTQKMLDGFQGGQLYVVGARPSVGKTALVTTWVLNLLKLGKVPFVQSLEMKKSLLQARIASSHSSISIGSDPLDAKQLAILQKAIAKLGTMKWFVEDTPRIDIEEICSSARRLKDSDNIDALFIDYLQIIQNKEFKANDMRMKVGANCYALKQLSKELDIPVIVPAQLKRKQVFTQKGQKAHIEPELQDLKESGDIEQDADVVMLLDRGTDGDGNDFSSNIIAKNRNGPTGKIDYEFKPALSKFTEI